MAKAARTAAELQAQVDKWVQSPEGKKKLFSSLRGKGVTAASATQATETVAKLFIDVLKMTISSSGELSPHARSSLEDSMTYSYSAPVELSDGTYKITVSYGGDLH